MCHRFSSSGHTKAGSDDLSNLLARHFPGPWACYEQVPAVILDTKWERLDSAPEVKLILSKVYKTK